jgi:heptosyltransferase-2
VKPKLLILELWGLGDLVIATPFLQAASEHYAVTLVAKPYARELQPRLWNEVTVVPFVAPWTAFRHKYLLLRWPWREITALTKKLRRERFDIGASARWDPRNDLLLTAVGARKRLGFPRLGSRLLLTSRLQRPEPRAHRYENWRVLASALGLELPPRDKVVEPKPQPNGEILVHTGAAQPVRVWSLPGYLSVVKHLRQMRYRVRVACDLDQRNWWLGAGETDVVAPRSMSELFALFDQAGLFIGNDSGPGHLAALMGVPVLTLFGPQLPEWFAPLHPQAEWLEGKPCPYKPCFDSCRFPVPICLAQLSAEEVINRAASAARRHVRPSNS